MYQGENYKLNKSKGNDIWLMSYWEIQEINSGFEESGVHCKFSQKLCEYGNRNSKKYMHSKWTMISKVRLLLDLLLL